jgi:hypothetical protein
MKTPKKSASPAPEIRILCQHTRLVDPATLKPHPQNPKRHPPEQLRVFEKVIREQGVRRPIVVSLRSGFVVSGHGLLQTLLNLGMKAVPVDEQDFPSEEAELAHLVADNKLPELGETSEADVRRILKQLEASGIDTEIAGILKEIETAELREVKPVAPPAMSWVLIGIPTVKFGEINAAIETIAARPDSIVETTVANA